MWYLILFTLIVGLLIIFFIGKTKNYKSKNSSILSSLADSTDAKRLELDETKNEYKWPPGIESSDPELGNFPDFAKAGSLHQFLLQIHKEHGPIVSFYWGKERVVSLGSAQVMKPVAKLYNRPVNQFALLIPMVGKESTQFANDENWKDRQQGYIAPAFSHAAVKSYQHVFVRLARDLVKELKVLGKEGKEGVNIRPLTMVLASQSITSTSFGNEFTTEDATRWMEAYDFINDDFETRLNGSMPEAGSEREKKFDEHKSWMLKKAAEISARGKEKLLSKKTGGGPETKEEETKETQHYDSFVDYLIRANVSDERVFAEILSFAIGGTHTTGNAISWAIIYLAQHSEVLKKCQIEVKEVLGDRLCPDVSEFEKLKYLKQVIDETLRCSVLAPLAGRYSNEDLTIDEYHLPAKTPLILAIGVTLQDEKVWENPKEFNPERFNSENVKSRHRLAYQPFGFAGKRVCPGMRYSNVEILIVLCALLQSFNWKLVHPDQPIEQVFGLVTKPKEDVYLFFTPRS